MISKTTIRKIFQKLTHKRMYLRSEGKTLYTRSGENTHCSLDLTMRKTIYCKVFILINHFNHYLSVVCKKEWHIQCCHSYYWLSHKSNSLQDRFLDSPTSHIGQIPNDNTKKKQNIH